MSNIDQLRRTLLSVSLNNVDISEDINKHLISATFTDVEDGASDNLEIQLEDRDNAIVGQWLNNEINKRGKTDSGSGDGSCPYSEPSNSLKKGSSGNGVKWVQWYLNKAIGAGLDVDGSFGSLTRSAVLKFQKKYGLSQDGIVGPVTRGKMKSLVKSGGDTCPYSEPSNTLKIGSSGIGVKWLQWHLNKTIGAGLDVDGSFGPLTKNAVLKFQKKYSMTQSGTVNSAMRDKLKGLVKPTQTSTAGKNATLSMKITQANWDSDGKDISLNCGTFELDDVTMSGPPQTVTLKGTSCSFNSGIRTKKYTKGWQNTTLEKIAKSIANACGYTLMYLPNKTVKYTRKDQSNQTYIVFLQTLCKTAGLSLKVTNGTLVIFDQSSKEAAQTVRNIKRGDGTYSKYNFRTSLSNTAYSACHVKYTTTSGKEIEYTYTPPGGTYDEDTVLEVSNEKVESTAEAKQIAIAKLRAANKGETSGSFTMTGDLTLCAGLTVQVSGFGAFNGKYIIEKATHTIRKSGGFTTAVNLRQVINGY